VRSMFENARRFTSLGSVDRRWKSLCKVGGIALLLEGILYLVSQVTGFRLGMPANSQAYLNALSAHPMQAWVTYGLIGVADILLIPGMLALYLALKGINRNIMLVSALIIGVYVVLDLLTFIPNVLTLTSLTQTLATANSAQQATILAKEQQLLATIPWSQFLGWVVQSFGLLLAAIVMRKGIFGRFTANLGIIVTSLGIIGGFAFLFPGSALDILLTPALIAFGIFMLMAGSRLFRLGGKSGEYQVAPVSESALSRKWSHSTTA
jgi:hypothetical protein